MQSEQSSEELYKLLVEVRSAHDLEDKKWAGSHAIYVEIVCNGETKTTTIKENEINHIVWNESFIFECRNIPDCIEFCVRDKRMIIPNIHLGGYTVDLKKKLEHGNINFNNNGQSIIDDIVELRDTFKGRLSIKVMLQNNNYTSLSSNTGYNKFDQALNSNIIINNDIENVSIVEDEKEVHVLSPIKVKEQPIVIEKEVEYVKPVVIQQKIIHKEQPIIVEQPTVVEKHEHYRDETHVVHEEQKIVSNDINDSNDNFRAEDALIEKLENKTRSQYNDTTPIIEHEKERIIMETDIKTEPTKVINKQVIYEQPVEITKTLIEKVKPTVIENITLDEEHVHEKLEPQVVSENVQVLQQGDQFYSQNGDNNQVETR